MNSDTDDLDSSHLLAFLATTVTMIGAAEIKHATGIGAYDNIRNLGTLEARYTCLDCISGALEYDVVLLKIAALSISPKAKRARSSQLRNRGNLVQINNLGVLGVR